MRRLSFGVLGPVFLFFVIFFILYYLSPPFYTFDSYDYLHLSLYPKYGASHPLGFGNILYLLSKLSDLFNKKYYIELVLMWNALSLALFLSFGLKPLRAFFLSKRTMRVKLAISTLILVVSWFTITSLIYVSNSFWSEATNILHVALFCFLVKFATYIKKWQSCILAFLLSVWSYNTRYSEIVLPICFLGLAGVYYVRSLYGQKWLPGRSLALTYVLLFVFSLFGIQTASKILENIYPGESGKSYITNLAISASMQCALRCDVTLFAANCDTPDGKEIVEESKCSELIFGLKPFGGSVLDMTDSPVQIFRRVGPMMTIKWLLLAPFTYLSDTHALETGLFQFGDDQLGAKNYPEATKYYSQYLVGAKKLTPNLAFISLVQTLDKYFRTNKIFHMLTVIAVLLAIFFIFMSINPVVLLLSFYSLGTYLVFSYLNPHVPFRYLVIIIAPSFLAALIHFLGCNNKSYTL